MGILTLILGLLLPWLNGAAWMGAVQWRFGAGAAGERTRIWGYGFFLGYAFLGLLLLIQARLTGGVNWVVPMAVLTATTLIGAWLAIWLVASLLLTAAVSGLLGIACVYLIPLAVTSVKTLLFALGKLPFVGRAMRAAQRRVRETGELDSPTINHF